MSFEPYQSDPVIKLNNAVRIDLGTGKITSFIKFDTGNVCMAIGGANLGCVGVITNRERHPSSFDVVHMKDASGNSFATRISNIFVIGNVAFTSTRQWDMDVFDVCKDLETKEKWLGAVDANSLRFGYC
ncbi:hypothetical protein H8959_013630 [Pygathrix nigripes]